MSEYASFVQPLSDRDCQSLLTDSDCSYSGWLRKYSFRNKLKIFTWPQVYVVLCKGCVYYFGSEFAKRSHSFSLYGYNYVQRCNEFADVQWVFKIIHTHAEFRAYYFSASSEREMKNWMKMVKYEMDIANHQITGKQRGKADGKAFDEESLSYQYLEEKIYGDPSQFVLPQNYSNKRKSSADSDDDMDGRPPPPPPLPPRPTGDAKKRKRRNYDAIEIDKVTKKLNETCNITEAESRQTASQVRERRARPDGASVVFKKPEETGPITQEDYWGSIYFDESEDTREASEIIRNIGEDGVYLVRKRKDGSHVLAFFGGLIPRKMVIQEKDDKYFLSDKFLADTIEELVYHYYENNLPVSKLKVKLETPYKLHPKYKSV
ncbi:uncharacterized protein LOC126815719 [Patella vulgata]|uniref:uncharacterized protein LOC126815719 n=1 Tax=Patella vulgata TaxID=6465 RepID=UPI00217FA7C6|nr:uncharacterized protein LOC126815719 [Patella vulgata]XP_050397565.1 uncharacterized protein LOC126815719 [Patella vulgata]